MNFFIPFTFTFFAFAFTIDVNYTGGDAFVDDFRTFNYDLWVVENGYLDCVWVESVTNVFWRRRCAFASKKKVHQKLVLNEISAFADVVLELMMKNDCDHVRCCIDKKHCTKYSSGQIVSKDSYLYGTFTFGC